MYIPVYYVQIWKKESTKHLHLKIYRIHGFKEKLGDVNLLQAIEDQNVNDAAYYLVNELQQIVDTHSYYVYVLRSKMIRNVRITPGTIQSLNTSYFIYLQISV